MNPPSWAIEAAIKIANEGPCQKSQRGVVIFNNFEILSKGHNRPPKGFYCNGSDLCKESCSKLCLHAERVALNGLVSQENNLQMLHIKTVEGLPVPSTKPSCWQCSRDIEEDERISWFWLLEEKGWVKYPSLEFHKRTLENCGLPIIF